MEGPARVTVRLFASLREAAGSDRIEIEVPAATPVGAVWALLPAAVSGRGELPPGVRYALNRRFTLPGAPMYDGDEVALIPPVSGGAGPDVRLTRGALRLDDLMAAVADATHGGTAAFLGTTRRAPGADDVEALVYEAYEEMAEEELRAIAEEAGGRFGARVAIAHRLGPVPVAEASVAVAASAPHRDAAFGACRHAIDALKQRAPIWKQEVRADGTTAWRDGIAAPAARPGPAAARPVR